ncbi:DinB family protein [Arenibacter sp. 6A1]|uniref:DinB family protein n=1 Tax=Arenibacter sp. 6A1 TaxID=2720391 RepID=UPI001444DFD9|nr:DinB family protein [Arenibacter sp. 6A1]NKI26486.1 DinB family protein [Arenibacter sp. 6A1]
MEKVFDITLKNRKLLYKFLKETPKENLLEIPNGFRNNIWWNIAHVVVTQQLLVYKLGGQQMRVDEALVDKFKKGTAPDGTATDEEIDLIGNLLISTVEWVKKDYEDGIFTTYNTYTTSVDVTLEKVEDALAFNAFHEGIHLGAVLALSKVVGGKAN